jgi:hypothetical protein
MPPLGPNALIRDLATRLPVAKIHRHVPTLTLGTLTDIINNEPYTQAKPPRALSAEAQRMRTPEQPVTIGEFRTLAQKRGWSEDWLIEQCRGAMDNPREVVREILSGYGMTKPAFTGYHHPARRVSLKDTVLVWRPLITLYLDKGLACACGCEVELSGKQRYATPACRKRASRWSHQKTAG